MGAMGSDAAIEAADVVLMDDDPRKIPLAIKIAGKTAIPAGTYLVKKTMSPRFKKVLPEILNVPNYTGVRIHAGNTAADTEGCLLLGFNHAKGAVLDSANTVARFMTTTPDEFTLTII